MVGSWLSSVWQQCSLKLVPDLLNTQTFTNSSLLHTPAMTQTQPNTPTGCPRRRHLCSRGRPLEHPGPLREPHSQRMAAGQTDGHALGVREACAALGATSTRAAWCGPGIHSALPVCCDASGARAQHRTGSCRCWWWRCWSSGGVDKGCCCRRGSRWRRTGAGSHATSAGGSGSIAGSGRRRSCCGQLWIWWVAPVTCVCVASLNDCVCVMRAGVLFKLGWHSCS